MNGIDWLSQGAERIFDRLLEILRRRRGREKGERWKRENPSRHIYMCVYLTHIHICTHIRAHIEGAIGEKGRKKGNLTKDVKEEDGDAKKKRNRKKLVKEKCIHVRR